ESWAPKPITGSPGERVAHAAVDRDRAARRLCRAIRGEKEHRLGDVLGQDPDTEQVALAIEVLEPVDGDPLRGGALAPDLVRPELRILEHGVGVHDVRADTVRRAF